MSKQRLAGRKTSVKKVILFPFRLPFYLVFAGIDGLLSLLNTLICIIYPDGLELILLIILIIFWPFAAFAYYVLGVRTALDIYKNLTQNDWAVPKIIEEFIKRQAKYFDWVLGGDWPWH